MAAGDESEDRADERDRRPRHGLLRDRVALENERQQVVAGQGGRLVLDESQDLVAQRSAYVYHRSGGRGDRASDGTQALAGPVEQTLDDGAAGPPAHLHAAAGQHRARRAVRLGLQRAVRAVEELDGGAAALLDRVRDLVREQPNVVGPFSRAEVDVRTPGEGPHPQMGGGRRRASVGVHPDRGRVGT